MTTTLTRLLAQREQLAEQANRALAHGGDNEATDMALRTTEDTVARLNPQSYRRRVNSWLRHDSERLRAHLAGEADNCPQCTAHMSNTA